MTLAARIKTKSVWWDASFRVLKDINVTVCDPPRDVQKGVCGVVFVIIVVDIDEKESTRDRERE